MNTIPLFHMALCPRINKNIVVENVCLNLKCKYFLAISGNYKTIKSDIPKTSMKCNWQPEKK